ncbi:hypothetical protein ZWY2020_046470 [Hordeum vulgare]|nr:hypothetical protein ZWY2020_046470 [Hordeum vulgare]
MAGCLTTTGCDAIGRGGDANARGRGRAGREESEERKGKGGRREDGGAPATGLASHAVLGVEDPRSPLARCRHDLACHRPPRVLFSPNGAYMAISIQAPGEDTTHCPNVLLYMGGAITPALTAQAKIVQVIYDDKTGQSRRFGYVTMSALEEAEKAVRTYHGYLLEMFVSYAKGDIWRCRIIDVYITALTTGCPFEIFVCNLPWQVDNSWLEKLFSTHDKVVDARVVYYECRGGTRRSRGFGFVTMATEEQSYYAINSLNKQILEGRLMKVKVSREKLQQGY